MNPVEDFIYDQEGDTRHILSYLHTLMTDLGMISKIRYRIPFYYQKSWVCYLNPLKSGGVEWAFIRGNELSNAQGLLDQKDRKQIAGITLLSLKNLPEQALREVIAEALILDETVPYASKRKKRHP
jgi:hypothetical protein